MTTPERYPFVGIISGETDPPGISRDQWLALVASSDSLVGSGDDGASVVGEGGRVLGTIQWSASANELDVHGVGDELADVAWNVASALGGHYVTLEELTRC